MRRERGEISLIEIAVVLVVVALALGWLAKEFNAWEARIEQRGYDRRAAEDTAKDIKAEKEQRAETDRRNKEREAHEAEDAEKLAAAKQALDASNERLAAAEKRNRSIDTSDLSLRNRVKDLCGRVGQAGIDTCLAGLREATERYATDFAECRGLLQEGRSVIVKMADGLRRTVDAAESCVSAYTSLTPPVLTIDKSVSQPAPVPTAAAPP